jgi:hypothetical protein
MHTYPTDRPEPIKTSVKRHPSGLAHIKLRLHEDDVPKCKRCSRCASKIKAVDEELGHMECGHRMPASKVSDFIWGPPTVEPDHPDVFEDEQPERDRVGFPREASIAFIEFLGRHTMIIAWSDAAWLVRGGRLIIVPTFDGNAPEFELRPLAARSKRFYASEKLEIETKFNDGRRLVHTVTPRIGEDFGPQPTPDSVKLEGNGGIPWVDIAFRKDLIPGL